MDGNDEVKVHHPALCRLSETGQKAGGPPSRAILSGVASAPVLRFAAGGAPVPFFPAWL